MISRSELDWKHIIPQEWQYGVRFLLAEGIYSTSMPTPQKVSIGKEDAMPLVQLLKQHVLSPQSCDVKPERTQEQSLGGILEEDLQSYLSAYVQGFKDEDLGSSPGWWAPSLVTYCPSRPLKLTQTAISKHCERVDE